MRLIIASLAVVLSALVALPAKARDVPAPVADASTASLSRSYACDLNFASTTTRVNARSDAFRVYDVLREFSRSRSIVSAAVLAAKAIPRLPGGVAVPIGNSKYGLEHIVRRHHYDAVTPRPASKFARDLGAHGIRRTIREAVGIGGPWRVEGSSRVLETGLGRTIGTDLAGNPTSRIRIVTDDAGSVITAYPIP